MFTELSNDKPYLKLALQGFAGDGKTRTAAEIAIGVHKLIGSDKPIAIYDTEQAAKALKPLFAAASIKAVSTKSRTLASLSEAMKLCEGGAADVLIIDSITHVWESFIGAYMAEKKRARLEFQDWGVLKPKWKRDFSDHFVQANCHIIFTGRAGYEYEDEKDENGKRQIYKSGIKMKAENEVAFEPDILVLMEKQQDILGEKKRIYRTATILKDRTSVIDGKTLNQSGEKLGPDFEDFYPAIKVLLDGALQEVHGETIPDTFEDFENKFSKIGKEREKLFAEIDGCFALMGLGTGARDKQTKAWTLNQVYGVNSMEMLGKQKNESIRDGLKIIATFANQYKDYFNQCLDNEVEPDGNKVREIMKGLLPEPVK